MECNKCTDEFESPSALSSLGISGSRVSFSFEFGLDSLSHYLMSLVFGHELLYFIYFGVFDTLRISNWRLDVLVVMTFRFWEKIFSKFLSFLIMLVVCMLGLDSLVRPPRRLSVCSLTAHFGS